MHFGFKGPTSVQHSGWTGTGTQPHQTTGVKRRFSRFQEEESRFLHKGSGIKKASDFSTATFGATREEQILLHPQEK